MKVIVPALKEIWRLFVDDGSLALAIVAVVAAVALLSLAMPSDAVWRGGLLVFGSLAVLITNVVVFARRHR